MSGNECLSRAKSMDIFTRIELFGKYENSFLSDEAPASSVILDRLALGRMADIFDVSDDIIRKSYDVEIVNSLLEQEDELHRENQFENLALTINIDISNKKNRLCKGLIFNSNQADIIKFKQKLQQQEFNHIDNKLAVVNFYIALLDDLTEQVFRVVKHEAGLLLSSGCIELSNEELWVEELSDALGSAEYIVYFNQKYPVLVRRCQYRVKAIYQSLLNLLNCFDQDYHLIKEHFFADNKQLELTHIERGKGDSHNQGETVTILHFNNKERLVYKRRDLSSEKAFEKYIHWLNKSQKFDLRVAKTLYRGEYGWQEFIKNQSLNNKKSVENYFYRYGALTAACYAINLTDIHYENLIACGEHPIIIDLETLAIKPEINIRENEIKELSRPIFDSAIFTGLINEAAFGRSSNVAPLGNPVTVTSLADIRLDICGKRVIEVPHKYKMSKHCVTVSEQNKKVEVGEFEKQITDGFTHAYNLILDKKEDLLEQEIDLIFADISPRFVFRPTQYYSKLLSVLKRPESSIDFCNQELLLFKLLGTKSDEAIPDSVIMAEWACLSNGDIPYFSCQAESTNIKSGSDMLINNVLSCSAIDGIKDTIISMTETKKRSEISLIRNSLACNNNKGDFSLSRDLKSLYTAITDNIRVTDNQLSFIDIYLPRTGPARYQDMSRLYHLNYSLPGVCFSLAYYENSIPQPESKLKARIIAKHIMQHMNPDDIHNIGMNDGSGGVVYLFSHLAHLYQSNTYLVYAKFIFNRLLKALRQDRLYDIFSGAAGALLAGISLYQVVKSRDILDQLEIIGDYLLEVSDCSENIRTWRSSTSSAGASTGFAHGISGVAYSLLKLYQLTKNIRYLEAAKESKAFIDTCFRGDHWSESLTEEVPFNAWCHGSIGITLFLLEYGKVLGQHTIQKDIDNSLQRTLDNIQMSGESLCHGTYGNIELLLSLQTKPDFYGSFADMSVQINSILVNLENKPVMGGARGIDYSLFNGISGIGYQLLRLDNPDKTPSILTFSTPEEYG